MGDGPGFCTRAGAAGVARRTRHPARHAWGGCDRIRGLDGGSLTGNLLVSEAALCWSSYTAFSIFMLRRYSPLTVAGYTMLVAGLAVFPFASLDLVRTDWGAVSSEAWAAAYSAFVVAAFGFAAWQWGIGRIGANRCSCTNTS